MEIKRSDWITINISVNRKLKRESDKANLFSIPFHKGLSVWISKKCLHGSRKDKSLAIGIKANDEYIIWIYDNESKTHLKSEIWQGQFLINLFQKECSKASETNKIHQEALSNKGDE